MRSILKVPIKVEMQPVEHMSDHVLTVDELASQIEEARKGKAKVDNSYVGYQDAGHLFEYKYDYVQYLESMAHILKEARARPQPERYKNKREMIIQ